MSNRDQDSDLDALLAELLSDGVEPEELARLASSPESFDAEERSQLERRISESPALADQLRVLREFDVSAALGSEAEEPHPAVRAPRRTRRAPPRRSRWTAGWLPLAAAAAAGFLMALVAGRWVGPDGSSPQLAALESELRAQQADLERARQELAQASDRLGQRERALDSAQERVASLETELAESRAAEAATQAELIALRDAQGQRAEQLARQPVLPAPPQDSAPVVPEAPLPTRDPFDLGEPFQIAMASDYRVPDPGAASVRPLLRSDAAARIAAAAPDRAGWAYRAGPSLYWYAATEIEASVNFAIARQTDDVTIAETRIEPPLRGGFHRIDLAELGVELREGETYLWSLTAPDSGGGLDLAMGGIRREPLTATLRQRLEGATPAQRLDALEQAGFWYEAFDLLSRWIERHPTAENLIARRDALLARAGVSLPEAGP